MIFRSHPHIPRAWAIVLLALCMMHATSCRPEPEPTFLIGTELMSLAPAGTGQPMVTNGMLIISGVDMKEVAAILSQAARVPKIPRQVRVIRLEDSSRSNKVEVSVDGFIVNLEKLERRRNEWKVSNIDLVRE